MLKAVTEAVSILSSRHSSRKNPIPFLKEGEKLYSHPQTDVCKLFTASDCQLKVDLGKQLKVPEHIRQARFRPDLLIYSDTTKQVIMWELIVPWKEHMEEVHERKIWWRSAEAVAGSLTANHVKWAARALLAFQSAKLWQGLKYPEL